MNVIYLDHNSTTPLLPEVATAMAEWEVVRFGNPSSQHQIGRRARQALGAGAGRNRPNPRSAADGPRARSSYLHQWRYRGQQPGRLRAWPAGRTPRHAPGEMIVSSIEHPSVAAPLTMLERRGWTIHRLGVTRDGVVDIEPL